MKRLVFSLLAALSAMTAFGQGIPYILNKGGRGTNTTFRGINYADSVVSTNVATTNLSASQINMVGTGTPTISGTSGVSFAVPSVNATGTVQALTVKGTNVWDSHNVMFWGATGDGVTDDTAAFQAALNANGTNIVLANGGLGGTTIKVPRGTNLVSALSLTPGTVLEGEGMESTVLIVTGAGLYMHADTWSANGLVSWGVLNMTIKSQAAGTSYPLIWCDGTNAYNVPTLQHLQLSGRSAGGISLTNLIGGVIDDVRPQSTLGDGLCIEGKSTMLKVGAVFSAYNAGAGFRTIGTDVQRITFDACSADWNTNTGWSISGRNLELNGCSAEKNLVAGIYATNLAASKISGGYIDTKNELPAVLLGASATPTIVETRMESLDTGGYAIATNAPGSYVTLRGPVFTGWGTNLAPNVTALYPVTGTVSATEAVNTPEVQTARLQANTGYWVSGNQPALLIPPSTNTPWWSPSDTNNFLSLWNLGDSDNSNLGYVTFGLAKQSYSGFLFNNIRWDTNVNSYVKGSNGLTSMLMEVGQEGVTFHGASQSDSDPTTTIMQVRTYNDANPAYSVGIGSKPFARFSVQQDVNGQLHGIGIKNAAGTGTTYVYNNSANESILDAQDGSGDLVLNKGATGGRVGIGASPTARLFVKQAANGTYQALEIDNAAGTGKLLAYIDSADIVRFDSYDTAAKHFSFNAGGSGGVGIGLAVGQAPRARLDDNGSFLSVDGNRQFFHDSSHTFITNVSTLISYEWNAGEYNLWYNGTKTITESALTGTITASNVTAIGTITATNGFYTTAPTNGVAPPSLVYQPIGLFGFMGMSGSTNTVTVGSSGTYYVVTNFNSFRTNNFVVSTGARAGGYLTNLYAGFYRISYYLSCVAGNSDTLEVEVNVNGTGKEEISGFATYDNPARMRVISGGGILYLPANSYVSLQVNNRSAASNVTIWRGGLTIGTP